MNPRFMTRSTKTGFPTLPPTLAIHISRVSHFSWCIFLLYKNFTANHFVSPHCQKEREAPQHHGQLLTVRLYCLLLLLRFRWQALQTAWFVPWITQDYLIVFLVLALKKPLAPMLSSFLCRQRSGPPPLQPDLGSESRERKMSVCILSEPRWLG